MASKDFAMLFVIDKWLLATKEMSAECRGWYLNLILHQYDKGDLPDDIEELANLSDVRFSEFNKFQQVWQQVLKQKFNKQENGRLKNSFADEILKSRETFKTKRSEAGKWSSVLRKARIISKKKGFLEYLKTNLDINTLETSDSTHVEQVLKQMFQLYRDINEDINRNIVEDKGKEVLEEKPTIPTLQEFTEFAIAKKPTVDIQSVELKYQSWMENKWRTGGDKPRQIKNWKSTLLNTLPHLKNGDTKNAQNGSNAIAATLQRFAEGD